VPLQVKHEYGTVTVSDYYYLEPLGLTGAWDYSRDQKAAGLQRVQSQWWCADLSSLQKALRLLRPYN